ncbi:MAG: thioredoxin family protein [Thermoplasmata archaeon]
MSSVKDINYDDLKKLLDRGETFVLDLWAEWCHPCKLMMPLYEELSESMDACQFYRINVDENSQIIDLLNVNSIPRIIVFVNGVKSFEMKGLQRESRFYEIRSKMPCQYEG